MKKANLQQFMLEKGERVGLGVAAGIAFLLIAMSVPKIVGSGSAKANADSLKQLSTSLAALQERAIPGEQHKPGPLRTLGDFSIPQVDDLLATTWPGFFGRPNQDRKRQVPTILKPDEFQLAFLRAPLPALQFTEVSGEKTKIYVLEGVNTTGEEGKGPRAPGYTPRLAGLARFAGRAFGGGGMPAAFMQGGAGAQPGQGEDKVKLKLVSLEEAEKGNLTPATKVLPKQMVIVAASFPFKQQVEEFKRALRLRSDGAVLSEWVRIDKKTYERSFTFKGFEVERMTLNEDGSDGKTWDPLDLEKEYKPLVLITGRNFVPDDESKYGPILQVSRGLVLPVFKPMAGEVPDLVAKLDNIQKTVKKLQENTPKEVLPPSKFVDTGFDIYNLTTQSPTGNTGEAFPMPGRTPGFPMTPTMPAGEGAEYYGNIPGAENYQKVTDTPIDHCLLRFLDVTVQPGNAYKYRIRVRMLNPNFAPSGAVRKDTYLQFTTEAILKSDWAVIPEKVVVPPDQYIYAVDQRDVEPKLKGYQTPPSPNEAVLQIHRWVDKYYPTKNSKDIRRVGEWLVAARMLIERGEYIQNPAYPTKVPVKKLEKLEHELDVNRGLPPLSVRRRQDAKEYMPVPFGIDASGRSPILVDFDGGSVYYTKTILPKGEDAKPQTSRIRDDVGTEVLIMRPDGTMIARNSATDAELPERTERYKTYLDRIEKLKDGKKGNTSLFGRPGGSP
jgi:hypothetical protein